MGSSLQIHISILADGGLPNGINEEVSIYTYPLWCPRVNLSWAIHYICIIITCLLCGANERSSSAQLLTVMQVCHGFCDLPPVDLVAVC